MFWLGGILAGLVVLLFAGTIYESKVEAADTQAYPPPGQMVDVGGYRIHLNCMGTGSPTVVIDAGLGGWSSEWGIVQPEVAKTTRICTYDRAGMGWSEPGPLPRDASQFSKELHLTLQNANIVGPYIMVGHSLGGLPTRVFTHEYSSDIVGVVLIESMVPAQSTLPATKTSAQTVTQTREFSFLPFLARTGLVRLLAKIVANDSDGRPDEKASFSLSVRPQLIQAVEDEARGIPDSLAQARAVTSFGDLPLIVLSRGLDLEPKWQAGQADLLQLSTNSQHLVAEKSNHNIELNQPDAAVAAILKMVALTRK